MNIINGFSFYHTHMIGSQTQQLMINRGVAIGRVHFSAY